MLLLSRDYEESDGSLSIAADDTAHGWCTRLWKSGAQLAVCRRPPPMAGERWISSRSAMDVGPCCRNTSRSSSRIHCGFGHRAYARPSRCSGRGGNNFRREPRRHNYVANVSARCNGSDAMTVEQGSSKLGNAAALELRWPADPRAGARSAAPPRACYHSNCRAGPLTCEAAPVRAGC